LRIEREEVADPFGLDAALRRLAGEVDLDERRDLELRGGRLGCKRMTELARRIDDLRLPALQVTDEVPPEHVRVATVFRFEILRPVLADDLDSGVGQRLHVVE